MAQYGFFFDQSRCSGCQACAVACKSWNGLPPGPVKYLRVYEYEKGAFPLVETHVQWVPCYHCENPVCLKACPNKAIRKHEKYGAVLIEEDKCQGTRRCWKACPYGSPVFASDDPGVKAGKCTMCVDRLESGELPICVASCVSRALDFGPLAALREKYGNQTDLEDLPPSRITAPSVIFKPRTPKRQLVHYDAERALELMKEREPFPPLFSSISEVVDIPTGLIRPNKLELKHRTVDDLMRCTRNHEG